MTGIQAPSPSSKIQILDVPVSLPGKCIVCGSVGGDGRKFLDIGLDIDFYGVVYFCNFCFQQGSNHLGYASPEQIELLKIQLENAANRISTLETENVKFRAALSQLDFLGNVTADITPPVDESEEISEAGSDDAGASKSTNSGGRTNAKKSSSSGESIDSLI